MRKKAVFIALGGAVAVAAFGLGMYSCSDQAADKAAREAQAAALTGEALALTREYGAVL